MKNSLIISILLLALAFVACEPYEDYSFESYDYSAAYFPYQELRRTVVVGEGMEIKVGVYLGGIRNNKEEQVVTFKINESLLDDSGFDLLPADYYTLSNNSEITVPEGILQGFVDVKFDSLKFANDPLVKGYNYAIPFEITGSTLDTVPDLKKTVIIPITYMNTYEGNFYQIGAIKRFNAGADTLENQVAYGDQYDYTLCPIRKLSTVSMDTVAVEGIADQVAKKFGMYLVVDPATNKVKISPIETSPYLVENDGESTWDPKTRTFKLSYKFEFEGKPYKVKESLIFRNRVRDNINEWRWPGFDGNL